MYTSDKLPIGTQSQYDNVTSIYQSFIDQGLTPQVAAELTNQKVAEKGWTGFVSGDNKRFSNPDDFATHTIQLFQRNYPDSLKANNFNEFYKGLQYGKHKYNPYPNYNKKLLQTKNGVFKRLNYYNQKHGIPLISQINIFNPYGDYQA